MTPELPNEVPAQAGGPPTQIKFNYLKSGGYRVVHAEGVIGSLTPRLSIHMSFWNERFPIPQQVVHAVNEDGVVGEEIKSERKSREGIIRDVQVGVQMDLDTAKALRKWLDAKIQEAEKVVEERSRKQSSPS
jgi:hypothetical protein